MEEQQCLRWGKVCEFVVINHGQLYRAYGCQTDPPPDAAGRRQVEIRAAKLTPGAAAHYVCSCGGTKARSCAAVPV